MDKKILLISFIFLFGCLGLDVKEVQKKDICFYGIIDDSLNAIAKTENVTIRWAEEKDDLSTCRVLFLKDDNVGRYAGRALRTKIKTAVMNGATLMISKRAATLVKNDSSIVGWNLILGDVVPCTVAPTAKRETFGGEIVNGTFVVVKNDPATRGVQNLEVNNWLITKVAVKGGEQLAIIRKGESPALSEVAIVKANYGFGTVYYFAYNPLLSPSIIANIFYSVYHS